MMRSNQYFHSLENMLRNESDSRDRYKNYFYGKSSMKLYTIIGQFYPVLNFWETINNRMPVFKLLSTKWVDCVEEPMKYQAFLHHFGSMGGWLKGSWGGWWVMWVVVGVGGWVVVMQVVVGVGGCVVVM